MEDSFARVFNPHAAFIKNVCRRETRDPTSAEEAFQNSMVSIWRGLKGFQGRAKIRTWMYRVAVNECLMLRRVDAYQSRKILLCADNIDDWRDSALLAHNTTESAVKATEIRAVTRSATAKIPREGRTEFCLHYGAGFTNNEIAKIMGCSLAAAKSRIQRGKLFFIRAIKRSGYFRAA